MTPRKLALWLRSGLTRQAGALHVQAVSEISDDHNDNQWRSEVQAVNFQVTIQERLYLVTVEDITEEELCVNCGDPWEDHVAHQCTLGWKSSKGDETEYRTISGKLLTDAEIEALADEAERGYDVRNLPDEDEGR
jgi:hypothetical protein